MLIVGVPVKQLLLLFMAMHVPRHFRLIYPNSAFSIELIVLFWGHHQSSPVAVWQWHQPTMQR